MTGKWKKAEKGKATYRQMDLLNIRLLRYRLHIYLTLYDPETYVRLTREYTDAERCTRIIFRIRGNCNIFYSRESTYRRLVIFRPDICLHSLYTYTEVLNLCMDAVKY